jgi:NhaA family Na+:H+ antiporter
MPRPGRRLRAPLSAVAEFVSVEALGGIALLAATVVALVWANVSWVNYVDVWSTHVTIGVGSFSIDESVRDWINDGLMTVFFFVVGLEIKRELVRGELRDPRTASLPVLAAIGGMVVPAALFIMLNAGGNGLEGWATPMATDIAFAVAILAVLGDRVPSGAKLFLLTLAIADDIGAIVVIAIFYSDHVSLVWLGAAVAVVLAILVMQRARVSARLAYVVPAFVLWLCVFESGVHATIAGVALGLLTPARPFGGKEVIEGLEHRLHPWSSFAIIPLFALANTGIPLGVHEFEDASKSAITWGIVLGLVVGKPLGIVAATLFGLRTRLGRLPPGMRRAHIFGVGQLAGIGFTVALFVASLSFTGANLAEAKVAILVASTISAVVGGAYLLVVGRRFGTRDEPAASADAQGSSSREPSSTT